VPVSDDLVWLIGQLRTTASRRERLRLLARGWRTVRDLSPTDRLAVAKELGFDGAEQLVEQLSRRGGASPAMVLELLEQAEAASPEEIAAIMRDASNPEGRRSLGERFLNAAKHWVADLESWEDPQTSTDQDSGPTDVEDAEVHDQPETFTPVMEEALADDATGVWEPEFPGEGFEQESELGAEDVKEPEGVILPPPPPPPPADSLPADKEAVDDEQPTKEVDETPDFVAEPQPSDEPDDAEEFDVGVLLDRLEESSSMVRRLRELREVAFSLAAADRLEVQAVLMVFPDGWARRRALESLFRAGVPRGFETAMTLVDQIEDPAQRAWALSTLAATRSLNQSQIEEILTMPVSPAFRRRMKRQFNSP